MKRFDLVLDDMLHHQFYRLFPDHGQRTRILRRCVMRIISKAKADGELSDKAINEIADAVAKFEKGDPS